jgi:type II secretory pathway pseudopilin PulG
LSKKSLTAFTLVELSIVLLIIGLIIGGITAGSSLIRQANIRAVLAEINNISSAINTFNIQFNALPGDFTNAYNFWPGANCTNSTTTTQNAGNTSCNGNGDGLVIDTSGESVKGWYHLSQAGMLNGSFTGAFIVTGQEDATNSPSSKWPNTGYYMHNWWPPISLTQIWLMIGGFGAGIGPGGLVFTPMDSYTIDVKIDDGYAAQGAVSGGGSSGNPGSCFLGNAYLLTTTTPTCRIGVRMK